MRRCLTQGRRNRHRDGRDKVAWLRMELLLRLMMDLDLMVVLGILELVIEEGSILE